MLKRLLSSMLLTLALLMTSIGLSIQPTFAQQDQASFMIAQAPIFTGEILGEKSRSRYSIENIRDKLLPGIAKWGGGFIGAIAVLALIWAGIQFLTAGGDSEKLSQAAKTAFYVVAALLLMMFAYVLVYLFLTIFTPTTA